VAPAEQPHPPGESIRVFPLSNWTELDVWHYIDVENIPVVPLYFAKEREVIVRGQVADRAGAAVRPAAAGERRSGHVPHAIARLLAVHRRRPFDADTVPRSSTELVASGTRSASSASSTTIRTARWRLKKREGYF
jgi:sulfate adenylyltransferase subunit 2